jgi:peptidoglycan hydrolase-like protein with peptidoglycan-binding domain
MKRVAAALVAMGLGVVWVGAAKAADPEVAGLQVALRAHGLYQGAIDGIAGPQTRRAVLVFQRRKGLAVDGRAGPRTRAALGPLGRPLLGRRRIARWASTSPHSSSCSPAGGSTTGLSTARLAREPRARSGRSSGVPGCSRTASWGP